MDRLLAADVVEDGITALSPPVCPLEIQRKAFPVGSKCAYASHLELLQERISQVDGRVKSDKKVHHKKLNQCQVQLQQCLIIF